MQKPIIELERIGSLLIEEIDTILICSCFDLDLGETQGTGVEHQKILSEMKTTAYVHKHKSRHLLDASLINYDLVDQNVQFFILGSTC